MVMLFSVQPSKTTAKQIIKTVIQMSFLFCISSSLVFLTPPQNNASYTIFCLLICHDPATMKQFPSSLIPTEDLSTPPPPLKYLEPEST